MTYDLRVFCLGAGVQSTAMLIMAQEGMFGEKPDCAIFSDTGWEPPDIYDHLEKLEKISTIPIHRVSTGNLREDILKSLNKEGVGLCGQPPFFVKQSDTEAQKAGMPPDTGGMLWRKCTTDYKIVPIQRKIKELLGYKKRQQVKKKAQQWLGISIDEASRMKDSRVKWIDHFYPLIEKRISRKDCIKWLKENGWDNPRKSACIGCPYHSAHTWADMRDNKPEEWKDAVDFDYALRKGKLPGVTGDAYLHRKMMPLDIAVDSTHNPDQIDMFQGECEGMCGL